MPQIPPEYSPRQQCFAAKHARWAEHREFDCARQHRMSPYSHKRRLLWRSRLPGREQVRAWMQSCSGSVSVCGLIDSISHGVLLFRYKALGAVRLHNILVSSRDERALPSRNLGWVCDNISAVATSGLVVPRVCRLPPLSAQFQCSET